MLAQDVRGSVPRTLTFQLFWAHRSRHSLGRMLVLRMVPVRHCTLAGLPRCLQWEGAVAVGVSYVICDERVNHGQSESRETGVYGEQNGDQ